MTRRISSVDSSVVKDESRRSYDEKNMPSVSSNSTVEETRRGTFSPVTLEPIRVSITNQDASKSMPCYLTTLGSLVVNVEELLSQAAKSRTGICGFAVKCQNFSESKVCMQIRYNGLLTKKYLVKGNDYTVLRSFHPWNCRAVALKHTQTFGLIATQRQTCQDSEEEKQLAELSRIEVVVSELPEVPNPLFRSGVNGHHRYEPYGYSRPRAHHNSNLNDDYIYCDYDYSPSPYTHQRHCYDWEHDFAFFPHEKQRRPTKLLKYPSSYVERSTRVTDHAEANLPSQEKSKRQGLKGSGVAIVGGALEPDAYYRNPEYRNTGQKTVRPTKLDFTGGKEIRKFVFELVDDITFRKRLLKEESKPRRCLEEDVKKFNIAEDDDDVIVAEVINIEDDEPIDIESLY